MTDHPAPMLTRLTPALRLPALVILGAALMAAGSAAEVLRLDADAAALRAVEVSPLATASAARLRAADAGVRAAEALRLPSVGTGAGLSRLSSVAELSVPLDGPGEPPVTIFPDIRGSYWADISIIQRLYAGGAIRGGQDAARSEREVSAAEGERVLADLRLAARSLYWLAVGADAGLGVARAQERRAERLLEDARALLEAGMAVRADELAAEARLAAAAFVVVRASSAAATSLAELRSLLQVAGGEVIELRDAGAGKAPAPPPPLLELQEAARLRRPELIAAEARLAALRARETVAAAATRPTVSFGGSWLLARPNSRHLPLEDAWEDSWSVGLVAGWTLFDGNRTRAELAGLRALREAVAAERAELERQVSLEVETSRLELEAARAALRAADAAQSAAAARHKASQERYDAGLAPITEMLDAQVDLSSAEREQVRSRATAWIASAALDRAVGR